MDNNLLTKLTDKDIEIILDAIMNKSYRYSLALKQKEWDYVDKYCPEVAHGVERVILPDTFKAGIKFSKDGYEFIIPNERLPEQRYCGGLKVLNEIMIITKSEEKK